MLIKLDTIRNFNKDIIKINNNLAKDVRIKNFTMTSNKTAHIFLFQNFKHNKQLWNNSVQNILNYSILIEMLNAEPADQTNQREIQSRIPEHKACLIESQ